jgi:hypothetical protein
MKPIAAAGSARTSGGAGNGAWWEPMGYRGGRRGGDSRFCNATPYGPWCIAAGSVGRGKPALVELLLAGVANVPTVVILVGELAGPVTFRGAGGRPFRRGDPASGVGGSRTADAATGSRQPPGRAELGGWPGLGVGQRWRARLARRAGAESVAGGQAGVGISTRPSMAIRDVRRCRTGKAYAAAVWLRASRQGPCCG